MKNVVLLTLISLLALSAHAATVSHITERVSGYSQINLYDWCNERQ